MKKVVECANCSLKFEPETERPFGVCPACNWLNPMVDEDAFQKMLRGQIARALKQRKK